MVFVYKKVTLLPLFLLSVASNAMYVIEKDMMCECGPSHEMCTDQNASFKKIKFKNASHSKYEKRCAKRCKKINKCKGFQITNVITNNGSKTRAKCLLFDQEVTGMSEIGSTRLLKEEEDKNNKNNKNNKNDENKDKKNNEKNNDKNNDKNDEKNNDKNTDKNENKNNKNKNNNNNSNSNSNNKNNNDKTTNNDSEIENDSDNDNDGNDTDNNSGDNVNDNIDNNDNCNRNGNGKNKNKNKTNCNENVEKDKETIFTCGMLEPQDNSELSVTPVTVQQCKLKVVHAHNFKEVKYAPYYGGHADWLEIQKQKDIQTMCSYYYEKDPPFWCNYKNSRPTGDSAQVENVEDDCYTPEEVEEMEILSRETFKITNAAHDLTVINSYHFFFSEDYYPELASWNDHMMAPIVKVYNLSNDSQDVIGKETGYSHPVSREIPSHTKDNNGNFKPNKDYEGNMRIVIKCTNECLCKVTKFETYSGDVTAAYSRMRNRSRRNEEKRARKGVE